MFNTKRIKELERRDKCDTELFILVQEHLEDLHQRIKKLEEHNHTPKESTVFEGYIPCSTCKCLIRKEDAIRGKSEIVRNDIMTSESCGDKKYGTFIEELVTTYYCHSKDCKPKK